VATELGKRYRCKVCGTEVLAVKAGEGTPNCDGQDMELLQPRPVPSSD
jgi:desulfoferrodoxin-like iron-binding protein